MVYMVAKLHIVLSGILVASLAGCGGGSSKAASPPDAPAATGGSGGSAGTGGGGTGGQLATTTSAAPGVCVPGASVACACVTGQQGAQTCTTAGTFAACVCAPPAVDAGATGGSDGAATGGSDGATAAGEARVTDAPVATDGVDASDAPFATGDTGAGDTPGTGTTPVIVSFTASPATIFVGETSTLGWTVTGATMLTIDQGVGSALISVLGTTSQVVTPTQTTTYTLTLNGSMSAQVTVTVDICSVASATGNPQCPMTGYGWVALGAQDSLSSPTCDNSKTGGAKNTPITAAAPCAGSTTWSSDSALCITGSIPVVQPDTAYPAGDYIANFGLRVGVNASQIPGAPIGKSYNTITLTFTGAPSPAGAALRAEIHRSTDGTATTTYCANVTSGVPIPLANFNTECWAGTTCPATSTTCLQLKATDVPNIDKVDLEVCSDTSNAYTVSNLCLTGITFGN